MNPLYALFEQEELFFKELYEGLLKRLDDSHDSVRSLSFRCLEALFSLGKNKEERDGECSFVERFKQSVSSFAQYTLEASAIHLDDVHIDIQEASQDLIRLLVHLFPASSQSYLISIRSRFHQPSAISFLEQELD